MINTYLAFLLLSLSFFGWGLLVYHKVKVHPAFIPVFVNSIVTCAVFIAGVLNFMPQMTQLVFFIGLVSCAIYFYRIIYNRSGIKVRVTPATVVLVASTLALFLLLRGIIYLHYDNFSHWGLIVKEMIRIDGLPNESTMITFRNYPPGSAVFIYYINKIIGYSESHALMAQGYLVLSNLTVLLVFCKWRNSFHILLSSLSCLTLLLVIKGNVYHLLVDTLLGVFALAVSIIAYYYRANWVKSVIVNTPLLILLILIKDSGKLFFILNVGVILWFVCVNNKEAMMGLFNKTRILTNVLLGILAMPLVTNYIWGEYTEKAYPNFQYGDNKFAISLENFTEINKSYEFIERLGPSIIHAATDISSYNVRAMILFNFVSFLFMLINYGKTRSFSGVLLKIMLFVNIFYVFYIFTLYFMYLLFMPEMEAIRLAGFQRYQSTAVIYILGLLMTSIIREWSYLMETHYQRPTKIITFIILAFIFIYPFQEHISSLIKKPEVRSSMRWGVKELVEKINNIESDKPKVLYYSPNSKNDRGFLYHVLRYEHLSENFTVVTTINSKEKQATFINFMRKSEYLVILDSDQEFDSFFEKYSYSVNPVGVYKVRKSQKELRLIPVE